MKKFIPLLVLILVGLGAWFFMGRSQNQGASNSDTNVSASNVPAPVPPVQVQQGQAPGTANSEAEGEEDSDDDAVVDNRQAAEVYKSADEALTAVKNGANEYDDLILSQFTQPGEDCTWCDSFYKSLKEMIVAPDAKPEQKSYYSELLAISGKVENISALVELIKNAKKPEEAELYAEALELAQGKDDVVQYLGEQIKSKEQALRDASISAVTNQGTRLAAELLYKEASESGNATGHYDQGIGLGELVPNEEAMPYLQEVLQKRDQFSHLAVKALLNSGVGGLRIVMDTLSNSKNPEFDRSMLKDAIDHVNYEDEIEEYAKKLVETSKQPLVVEFAKEILNDFAAQNAEVEEDDTEEPEEIPGEGPMSKMPNS